MLINILVFSLPAFLPHFQIVLSIVLCDHDPQALVCRSPLPCSLLLLVLVCVGM